MKFVLYEMYNQTKVGIWLQEENSIVDIQTVEGLESIDSMLDVIQFDQIKLKTSLAQVMENKQSYVLVPEADVKLCSPFPNLRRNVICLGFNYLDHVGETREALGKKINIPTVPIYFSKMALETIGPNGIIDGCYTKELDYEAELAIVIGKKGKNIPKEEIEDYIFGYTILNDVSARELQRNHKQYLKGKSLDTFTALGPCVVHKDDITNPGELNVTSHVNGELRQNSNTRHLLFDIPTIISDLSQGLTLIPGDIIATGTPAGVGMGFSPQRFLQPGDVIECTVEGIGTLENTVK